MKFRPFSMFASVHDLTEASNTMHSGACQTNMMIYQCKLKLSRLGLVLLKRVAHPEFFRYFTFRLAGRTTALWDSFSRWSPFHPTMYPLTPYPITPIGNFIGVILALVPLVSNIRKFSPAVWGCAVWNALYCFQMFVNAVIWHNNVNITATVWCDIGEYRILSLGLDDV